jgi:hypothetical protein
MSTVARPAETQPVCASCWLGIYPGRRPRRELGLLVDERCCLCGAATSDGITARVETYGPGIYAINGSFHVNEEEFIRGTGGNPENPRDVAMCRRALERVCGEHGIPIEEAV